MKRVGFNFTAPFFLITAIVLCFFIQQDLSPKRDAFLQQNYMDYTLPSKVTGVVSMEFKGIVSDFLFLKVSTFLGDKFLKQQKLEKKYADYISHSVDVITDLDPWFWDAYLFASMTLAWDFKRVDLANELLLKARNNRTWDFKPPYYMGFNHFYFLKDNINGAKYMMEAARLPDSPSYLTSLASRLSMYQNQYKPAILFLKDAIEKTSNPALTRQFEIRLNTLIILDDLEKTVRKYREQYGVFPVKITDLVEKGFIETIPNDPYGGKFFILKNGRVYTTSKMVFKKSKTR